MKLNVIWSYLDVQSITGIAVYTHWIFSLEMGPILRDPIPFRGHDSPLKGSLFHHPKTVTKNCQGMNTFKSRCCFLRYFFVVCTLQFKEKHPIQCWQKKKYASFHSWMAKNETTNQKITIKNSLCTPPKYNLVSQKLPSQKESGLPTIHFQGLC